MNNPYQVPMMNNSYMQSQNPYMDRMNFLQNYQQSLQQQPMQMNQQPMPQQIAGINGRIVQAVENINANEVPMDGSMAFFPKQDMSEIYVKSWNANGTINTTVYKPCTASKDNQTVNSMANTENAKFTLSDETTEVFMKRFDDIEKRLDEFISKKSTNRVKKEAESE